jgi:myotubularin-related protein 6/7/8
MQERRLSRLDTNVQLDFVSAMPENLYAFFHVPRPALALSPQGWHIYDPKAEFARQGVGSRTKAWRFCDLNAGYGVS